MPAFIQDWDDCSHWASSSPGTKPDGTASFAGASALDTAFAHAAHTEDRTAFTALMTTHKKWLGRYVERYVGSVDDARDIVQNCFVVAWSARASYDPTWPFSVWLRRIALNKCHDFGRRRKAYQAVVAVLGLRPEALEVADPAPQLDRVDAIQRALQRLHNSIGCLSASLRDPLILTALEGLSHKQAGDVLGLSAKAVELRIRRAKQQLARMIDPADLDELAGGSS